MAVLRERGRGARGLRAARWTSPGAAYLRWAGWRTATHQRGVRPTRVSIEGLYAKTGAIKDLKK